MSDARPPMRTETGVPFGDQIYDRLLQERIVMLDAQVEDSSANAICAQLLLLSAADLVRDI